MEGGSVCVFANSLTNIAICEHPKGSWHHSIGIHLPKSNAVALFPEEVLSLYLEGKIIFSDMGTSMELLKRIYAGVNETIIGTHFTQNLFALYQHLRSCSLITKRQSAVNHIADALNKAGYPLTLKKVKEENTEEEIIYLAYKTKEELKAGKVCFKVLIEDEEKVTFEELERLSKLNIKLAVVRESKVVMLNFEPMKLCSA